MQRIPTSLIFLLALGLFSFGATQASADGLVPGYIQYASYTESATAGYVTAALPACCEVSGLSVVLASDGESAFDPFGAGYDTGDGIQFTGPFTVTSASPAWKQLPGSSTFVLPATIPGCGSENEPTCEPTGIFDINTVWSGAPSYISMYQSDGTTLSDLILFDSKGPHGTFEIKFYSDPNLNVPEPGTFALLGSGFALAGLLRRKLLKKAK